MVTTLVALALSEGLVEGAVLTRSAGGVPQGVVATSREEVLRCSGSNYLAAPTSEALNRLPPHIGRVAVVGTPCLMLALGKMRLSPSPSGGGAPGAVPWQKPSPQPPGIPVRH